MKLADLEHPMRRAVALAAIVLGPPLAGALLFGARPPALLAVGSVAGLFGALVFPITLKWTPAIAFSLVLVPSLFAALAVFDGFFFVLPPVIVAVSALALFYRPAEERRRESTPERETASGGTSFNPDGSGSSGSAGYSGGSGGVFAGAGASAAWVAGQTQESSGGEEGGSGGGD